MSELLCLSTKSAPIPKFGMTRSESCGLCGMKWTRGSGMDNSMATVTTQCSSRTSSSAVTRHLTHYQGGHHCTVYATRRLPIWAAPIFAKFFEAFEIDPRVCSAGLTTQVLFFDAAAGGQDSQVYRKARNRTTQHKPSDTR
jgi:hypothetical protein